jgi:A1 cistron-splicing factor AAR2
VTRYTKLKRFIINKFDWQVPDEDDEEEDDEDAPVIVDLSE